MRTITLLVLTLCFGAAVRADFSYTTTRKTTGGMMASMGGAAGAPQTSKSYFKGQRMKSDSGAVATIVDFEAQTITTINTTKKTYSVKGFSDVGGAGKSADFEPKIDVRETGQRKTINGFNANEVVMTMQVDSPQAQQMGQMQIEMEMWLSTEVPGYQELHEFYQRNMARYPWAAMAGGANSGMQKAMADLQKKMASMHGVQVESVVRMKAAGGAAQMAQMQQAMAGACPQLQAMMAQGGPAAAAMKQQYDKMCGGAGGGAAASAGSSTALMEITSDSSDFSTASIPDSVFAIPAGFTKASE